MFLCEFNNTRMKYIGKKPCEGSLTKLGGLESAIFSHGPVKSPLSHISNQTFSIYIPTKFRIECNIWSSNQTGAIPIEKFQNWVRAEWGTCQYFISTNIPLGVNNDRQQHQKFHDWICHGQNSLMVDDPAQRPRLPLMSEGNNFWAVDLRLAIVQNTK